MSENDYFTEKKLMAPPMKRAANSDRMAYVLAEMSDLAYFPFEGVDNIVSDAAADVSKLVQDKKAKDISTYLSEFAEKILTYQGANLVAFEEILRNAEFELIGRPLNKLTTQGFLCKRIAPDEPNYLVLAFRGTEKNLEDWLTDANAIPIEQDGYRVHKGFYRAFNLVRDELSKR